MNDKLSAMSRMFTDWQTRFHVIDGTPARKIDLPFLPHETFLLPPSIRRLIQPDPRDIDETIWCKLTYAAATLTREDIANSLYPLAYFRAAALLWITSARRPNEIIRLPLGCIRRDWDPEMLNEYGAPCHRMHSFVICMCHPTRQRVASLSPFRNTRQMPWKLGNANVLLSILNWLI